MARIPYVDVEKLQPSVREAYDALPVELNIFKIFAHAERNFAPLLQLGGSILARQQLDGKLRELAILYVASDSGARYEWVQHVPIAERAGVTEAQVLALENLDLDADCFDSKERLALRFTREVARDVKASDATFADLAELLSPREIVELVIAIGYYMMVARVMETTAVDLDPPAGDRVIRAAEDGNAAERGRSDRSR